VLGNNEKKLDMRVKAEVEEIQGHHDDKLQRRIERLEAFLQQKDLVIQSMDDLLKVKDETLEAHKALIAEKDRIIKVRGNQSFYPLPLYAKNFLCSKSTKLITFRSKRKNISRQPKSINEQRKS
jgi:hypothetical protein